MILIGADFVPTAGNLALFQRGDASALFGPELERMLLEADFRIFNLETPLCGVSRPIAKTGANLSAPTDCVQAYRAIHTDLLCVANNHILDQGAAGLAETLALLRRNGIACVGAGADLAEAAQPFLFSHHGRTVGVYACAEHEFSIAAEDRPGANLFDPLESPEQIGALKARCDYLIVLYHGGKEHYQYPSPGLQKTCRKLVERGADLVVCQHSHCIGCEERWKGGTIVYGQGNFLFDNSSRALWQTSLLLRLDACGTVDYVPLVKNGSGVALAPEAQAREILDGFRQRSSEILQEGFVARRYEALARERLEAYLRAINGRHSVFFRLLDRLSGYRFSAALMRRRYGKRQQLLLQNYLECETHRELILAGLKQTVREPGGDV